MKFPSIWFWIVLTTLLAVPLAGAAQTVYVSENFEITMRTGPSTEHKILALVQSGEGLEVLKKGEDWTMVRDPDGKEGWVLDRYLTAEKPCTMVLERIRGDHDLLKTRLDELRQECDGLHEQKRTAETELARISQDHAELKKAYATLEKESSEFLGLKKLHQQVSAELNAEKKRSARLSEENEEMKRSRVIHWGLIAVGILLTGFFMGIYSSRRRRPRSSLY